MFLKRRISAYLSADPSETLYGGLSIGASLDRSLLFVAWLDPR